MEGQSTFPPPQPPQGEGHNTVELRIFKAENLNFFEWKINLRPLPLRGRDRVGVFNHQY